MLPFLIGTSFGWMLSTSFMLIAGTANPGNAVVGIVICVCWAAYGSVRLFADLRA